MAKRVLRFLGEDWEAEPSLDGLVLRSGSGQEYLLPSFFEAYSALRSGGSFSGGSEMRDLERLVSALAIHYFGYTDTGVDRDA